MIEYNKQEAGQYTQTKPKRVLRVYQDLEKSEALNTSLSFIDKSPSQMTWEEKEKLGEILFREADQIGLKIT